MTIFPGGAGDNLEKIKKTVTDLLTRNKVETVKVEEWGVRKLHYEIAKHTSGYFTLHICKIDPKRVKALAHDLEIEQNVIRYMIKRVA